jgi:hypothetical protein
MEATTVQQESQVEKRLAALEEQMAGLLGEGAARKDWKSAVGMWKDDEMSREIDRLGREWRESVTD